jgi:hypothetical protein
MQHAPDVHVDLTQLGGEPRAEAGSAMSATRKSTPAAVRRACAMAAADPSIPTTRVRGR